MQIYTVCLAVCVSVKSDRARVDDCVTRLTQISMTIPVSIPRYRHNEGSEQVCRWTIHLVSES